MVTFAASTPKKRRAKSSAACGPRSGSAIVAEVATQVTSAASFPAKARSRRMRQAVSAPCAPRKVWASSKTRNSSGASSKSPTSLPRVSSSSSCFTLVSRIRGCPPRSRIDARLARSSAGMSVVSSPCFRSCFSRAW